MLIREHARDEKDAMDTTMLPADAPQRLVSVCISSLDPGQVVRVTTRNTTYWISRVVGSTTEREGLIRGLMVHTEGEFGQRFGVAPSKITADDVIIVGRGWRFGGFGRTSTVQSIHVN